MLVCFSKFVITILFCGTFICCSHSQKLNKVIPATPEPIPVKTVPPNWNKFKTEWFTVKAPSNSKLRKYQGDDSSGYALKNDEFSFHFDLSPYNTCQSSSDFQSSYVYETGLITINGKPVKYIWTDLNRPSPGAAVNADGSKSKPIEKHLSISICYAEEQVNASVGFIDESWTQNAFAMLQSLRVQKRDK